MNRMVGKLSKDKRKMTYCVEGISTKSRELRFGGEL